MGRSLRICPSLWKRQAASRWPRRPCSHPCPRRGASVTPNRRRRDQQQRRCCRRCGRCGPLGSLVVSSRCVAVVVATTACAPWQFGFWIMMSWAKLFLLCAVVCCGSQGHDSGRRDDEVPDHVPDAFDGAAEVEEVGFCRQRSGLNGQCAWHGTDVEPVAHRAACTGHGGVCCDVGFVLCRIFSCADDFARCQQSMSWVADAGLCVACARRAVSVRPPVKVPVASDQAKWPSKS